MKLLYELLNIAESAQGTTLVGYTINKKLITNETKDEVWNGNITCFEKPNLISLKGAPNKVTGDFHCSENKNLESLKGCSKIVTGDFHCTSNNKLTSLKGGPEEVGGDFTCSYNKNLESLEDAPKKVGGEFSCCQIPKLTSLKGCPDKVGQGPNGGEFSCSGNPSLISLEGAPKEIGGDFTCNYNIKLTSLKGIHKQVTNLDGKFIAIGTPIKSHVLGLLLNGCTGVEFDNKEVETILNKYLPNTRGNKGLIDCQSELLDADLDDFAEL